MAYIKNIEAWCDSMSCQARAKVELFNTYNASKGKFCLRCGKVKVKLLNKQESEVRSALEHGVY